MEYQKTINLLDYTQNQPSKFRKNIELKNITTVVERIKPIVKLNLRL